MKHLIKRTFQFILITGVFACGGVNNKTLVAADADSAALADTLVTKEPRIRPQAPVDYMELLETEVFRGSVAKPEDVEEGRAVFAMRPLKGEHKALPLRMPYLVTARSDVHRDTFMVIMQCERIGEDTIIGVRNGWNQYKVMRISDVLCATFITPVPLDAFESSKRPL